VQKIQFLFGLDPESAARHDGCGEDSELVLAKASRGKGLAHMVRT
jgi:hypothetical protein